MEVDLIGLVINGSYYKRPHVFQDLFIDTAGGRTPRLPVSRFYWDLNPPVAIDFLREIKYGEMEIACKKTYFEQKGIIYLWVKDQWDGESAEAQYRVQQPEYDETKVHERAVALLIGPRRRSQMEDT